MALSMALSIFIFIFNIVKIHSTNYFVARARTEVREVIDFEKITTTQVVYFLFKNETLGAADTNEENNYLIVENVNKTCEGEGY